MMYDDQNTGTTLWTKISYQNIQRRDRQTRIFVYQEYHISFCEIKANGVKNLKPDPPSLHIASGFVHKNYESLWIAELDKI